MCSVTVNLLLKPLYKLNHYQLQSRYYKLLFISSTSQSYFRSSTTIVYKQHKEETKNCYLQAQNRTN